MLGACAAQPNMPAVGSRPAAIPVASAAKPASVAKTKTAAPLKVAPPAVVAKAETAAVIQQVGADVSAAEQAEAEAFFAQALTDVDDLPDVEAQPVAATTVGAVPDFFINPNPTDNETEIFFADTQIFPELMRLLKSADTKIQISYFLLGGDIGMNIAKILAERAAAGVEVEVMLDPSLGLGGPTADGIAKVVDYMRDAKIPFKMYPLALFGQMPNKMQKKFQINHNKVIVVDNETAYIGSMNLDDLARLNHDLMIRVQGPVAAELGVMLDEDWKYGNEPSMSTKALDKVRLSQTAPQERNTKELLLKAFAEAEDSIHVAMYEFGDVDLANGLIEAYKRGVDVRVILDQKGKALRKYGAGAVPDGMPNVLPAREMLEEDMQVRWFKPTRNDQELHMKAVCIDGNKLIAGSTNWTTNAFTRWRETSFMVQGETAAKFDAEFDRMWRETSTRIDKLSWKQLLTARLVEYMNRKDYAFW
jgi:phosphatidylserine/phosphatidylglycerophosphate/cardiolipin synthase-like enzyme